MILYYLQLFSRKICGPKFLTIVWLKKCIFQLNLTKVKKCSTIYSTISIGLGNWLVLNIRATKFEICLLSWKQFMISLKICNSMYSVSENEIKFYYIHSHTRWIVHNGVKLFCVIKSAVKEDNKVWTKSYALVYSETNKQTKTEKRQCYTCRWSIFAASYILNKS